MLIVCPTCANEYTLAFESIGPTGRVVRCAACRGAWFVPPCEEALQSATEPEAALEPGRNPFAPARRPRRAPPARRSGSRTPLALTIGLAASLALGLALRSTIVRAVPHSAAAFSAMGLPVNLVGLTLDRVTSQFAAEPAGRVLLVRGEIVNPTSKPIKIPPLAFEIEGRPGDLLYAWADRTARGELGAKETLGFEVRLTSPPPESQRLAVAFSTKGPSHAVASR